MVNEDLIRKILFESVNKDKNSYKELIESLNKDLDNRENLDTNSKEALDSLAMSFSKLNGILEKHKEKKI